MSRPPRRRSALVSALLLSLSGCGDAELETEAFQVAETKLHAKREPCKDRAPLRRAFFGDLHVHTALSSDAYSYDLALRPRDAYRYAFGEPVGLPPNDSTGAPTRQVRIERPLDFAAVTDHAEFLGEQRLCADPDSPVYDAEGCQDIRASTSPFDSPLALKVMLPSPGRDDEICGDDEARCDAAMGGAWREIIAAAEEWNDRSRECERATFIGYEYSSHRLGSNLHRNVIFRSQVVPRRPVSYLDAGREWQLWEILAETCLDSASGCDALAIPHNSNISNGRMFPLDSPGTSTREEEIARASLRARIEPVVEVMQHKGDSECRNGIPGVLGAPDEFCDFEKFENMAFSRQTGGTPGECWEVPWADWVPHLGPDCLSRRSYVRYALTLGLAEEERLGVNPFKLGLMASTDTHNAIPGAVDEARWPGHLGVADAVAKNRLSTDPDVPGNMANGPGGLIGVWAEENTRSSLFDAIRRREVFGTSGPRIQARFFGGWDLPADLCSDPEWLARADSLGVPMGSDLPSRAGERSPRFSVLATRDPGSEGSPGGLLQRVQIVKGWVDETGGLHQSVVDIAGGANDADVDPDTCAPRGAGAELLCGVWRDPDFDPARRAVYYARVLENPSCRHHAWLCLSLPEEERPPGCAAPIASDVQQERAWTSPIWYSPGR